jgi:hypothetical protein
MPIEIIASSIMSEKQIDERRELLGKQMNNFMTKLVEWSTEKDDVSRFSTFVSWLYNNNLQLLCVIVGRCFGNVIDRIEQKDDTLWTDPVYVSALIKSMAGESEEKYDFSKVFSTETNAVFTQDVHEEFWKRLIMITKLYTALIKIDEKTRKRV